MKVVKTQMIENFIVEQQTVEASRRLAAQSLQTANAIGVEGRALASEIAVMEGQIAATRALIAEKGALIEGPTLPLGQRSPIPARRCRA